MKSLPQQIADSLIWLGIAQPTPIPAPEPVISVPSKTNVRNSSYVTEPLLYDADAEFVEAARPTSVHFDLSKDVDHLGNKYDLDATLMEVSADGQSYRLRKVCGRENVREAMAQASERWEQLGNPVIDPRKLRESSIVDRKRAIDAAAERLTEGYSSGGSPYGDSHSGGQNQSFDMGDRYGDGQDANAEYIPIMGGPYNKQLYLRDYLKQSAMAFEAKNHNPIAHQLVEMQTAFVLGRGIDHQSTNNVVDAIWREFCERTNFYQDLEEIANDFWWQGETMMEFYDDDPKKGFLDYRMIDPSTIWEVVTDVEDIQKVFFYYQSFSTPYQQYVTGNIQSTKYIVRQIPANDVLHLRLNVSKYEKRGRSDLYSILGWLKRLKDLMNARVIKGQLEAAFVFDIEINAGDAQVAQANMQLPDAFKPGSNWVHNKNAQMKPVSSGIRANESQPDVAALLNLIAVGFGIPKEFIGEAGKGARAGALAATEPGTKRFEKRQRLIEYMAQKVCDRVLNNAVAAGRLKLDDVLPDARTVQRLGKIDKSMPTRGDIADEMEEKNESAAADAKQQQQDAQDQAAVAQKQQLSISKTQMAQQHELALNDQKHQHKQALAGLKANTSHTIKRVTAQESVSLRKVTEAESSSLTSDQKDRIAAIKETGKLSKEFIEFIFPSIAQEDRSAKLKDLALAEAMQWLPKSVSATMAAKELNITTYSFTEAWAQIVEEAEYGFSMAHVYAQDNQHTPATAMAQDVQEEQQAKQPIAPQNQMVNVPIPPAVAGDKLMPAQQKGQSGPGSVPPGQQPNSGATKVNKHSGPNPNDTDPTAKPHGYSAAANHPMTGAGVGKIKQAAAREAALRKKAIYDQLLRESLRPVMDLRTRIAQTILADTKATEELIEADNE